EVPPLGAELEALLTDVKPVEMRRPVRQWGLYALVSLLYGAGMLAIVSVRRDLGAMPAVWMMSFVLAFLVGFSGLAFLAIVPKKGSVSPRLRACGVVAGALSLAYVTLGLLFPATSDLSTVHAPTLSAFLSHADRCL